MNQEIKGESIPPTDTESNLKLLKVPLGEVGKWFHKKYNIINFTPEYFQKAISNFKANVLKHNPYLTYGHLKEVDSVDSERRRGELKDLVFEGRHLFGIFAATDEAYKFVKDREYLYASAEIMPDFMDKDTGNNVGPVLLRAALTNSPFLPASREVVALSNEFGFDSNDVCVLSVHQINDLIQEIHEEGEQEKIVPSNEDDVSHKEEETIVESSVSVLQEDLKQEPSQLSSNEVVESNLDNITVSQQTEEPMTIPVTQDTQRELPSVSIPEPEVRTNLSINEGPTDVTPLMPKALTEHVQTLTESIKNKVATKYKAEIASYAQTVEALRTELSGLREQLNGNQQKTKAYELSISQASKEIENANRQLLVDHMLGQGVPPVIANKFNEVSDAYLNQQSTIRLSIEGGEPVERTLLDAIAEIIISAANTPPITLSVNGSPYSKAYDPTGRTQYLSRIIERNNEIYRNEFGRNV